METSSTAAKPSRKALNACSFSSWYEAFCPNTIESRVIELGDDFIEYLNADGVFLPRREASKLAVFDPRKSSEPDEDGELEEEKAPSFAALEDAISTAIDALGGKVFVKLNWSSVQDAGWATGAVECRSSGEVLLMLKSSDMVNYDLNEAYKQCGEDEGEEKIRPILVLKRWTEINPAMVFRCFVGSGKLRGISQRQLSTFFPFLPEMRETVGLAIAACFEHEISGKFPLEDYAVDVYLDNSERVWILDFTVSGGDTDPLLFGWRDLQGGSSVEVRVVGSESETRACPLRLHRVPDDVLEAESESMRQFREFCKT